MKNLVCRLAQFFIIFETCMVAASFKLLKLIIPLMILKLTYCQPPDETFSKQYYEMLRSAGKLIPKHEKCSKIGLCNPNQDPIIQSIKDINTSKTLNKTNHTKTQDSSEDEDFNLMTTVGVILQEFQAFIGEVTKDAKEEYELEFQTSKSREYSQNFASIDGGAIILRISSDRIKSAEALLDDNNDKYMHTNIQLPIEIIISLKEEVSIERIVIKSSEYYSTTVNEFVAYGAFSLHSEDRSLDNWFKLVEASAKIKAGQQTFRTVNKVIRFLKLRIISAHGKWKYFTMNQIKVYGNSLYAQAMTNYKETASEVDVQPGVDIASIHLYDDLQKMILMAREGNKTIPQNNLIKYFFKELQKLAILEQKQILYMNNLTLKIQQLQHRINSIGNEKLRPKQKQTNNQMLEDSKKALKVSMIYNYFKPLTINQQMTKQKLDILERKLNNRVEDVLLNGQIRKIKDDLDHFSSQLEVILPKEQPISQTTLIIICVGTSFFFTFAAFLLAFIILSKQSKQNKAMATSTSKEQIEQYATVSSFSRAQEKEGRQGRKYRGKEAKR